MYGRKGLLLLLIEMVEMVQLLEMGECVGWFGLVRLP